MKYVCTKVRFKFFDGQGLYTVEYVYGISTWFIYPDNGMTNAVFNKTIDPKKSKSPNRVEAELILDEFINS